VSDLRSSTPGWENDPGGVEVEERDRTTGSLWYDIRQEDNPMSELILDADLRQRLNGGTPGTKIRDESGRVVGYFLSADEYANLFASYTADLDTPEAIEEARREMLAGGGVTTAELLERFAKMRRAMEATG
jgi:hypothetical protein